MAALHSNDRQAAGCAAAGEPRRNVELKARLPDVERARTVAARLATQRAGEQIQVDTYFHCAHGRLKLREIDAQRAELIAYVRADEPDAKASAYHLLDVPDAAALKAALASALGIRCVVRKRREIFLYHNVRIHLDQVDGLGEFLEFEAVLGPDVDAAKGRDQVADLVERFAVAESDLLTGSYGEMVMDRKPRR